MSFWGDTLAICYTYLRKGKSSPNHEHLYTENILRSLTLHFKSNENSLKLKHLLAKALPVLRYLGYCVNSWELELEIQSYGNGYIQKVSQNLQSHILHLMRCHLSICRSWLIWFWDIWSINPLNANSRKWSNTLNQFVGKLPTNSLSMFDHFEGIGA